MLPHLANAMIDDLLAKKKSLTEENEHLGEALETVLEVNDHLGRSLEMVLHELGRSMWVLKSLLTNGNLTIPEQAFVQQFINSVEHKIVSMGGEESQPEVPHIIL